ncbi:hypothetical protein AVO45_18705 [Ruegeria marisrubri]|uniref:Uncharacterized protein n=1 Tax=Ruegeria marisrubri TaxID=1685379 RepID=A0A0X3U4B6_9RHOB|nr:hypothetical protein AVO45_18705 [Ruegeria marisrubri]
MTQADPKFFQVIFRKMRQDPQIDVILTKHIRILLQAQVLQPAFNSVAHSSIMRGDTDSLKHASRFQVWRGLCRENALLVRRTAPLVTLITLHMPNPSTGAVCGSCELQAVVDAQDLLSLSSRHGPPLQSGIENS